MSVFDWAMTNAPTPRAEWPKGGDTLALMRDTIAKMAAFGPPPPRVSYYVDERVPEVYVIDEREMPRADMRWYAPAVYLIGSTSAYGGLYARNLAEAYRPEVPR